MVTKFNSDKKELIKQIIDNVNGYNYSIERIEAFLNKYSEYKKAYTHFDIVQFGIVNKFGECKQIKINTHNNEYKPKIEDFKQWLTELLEGGIVYAEDLEEVKRIANNVGGNLPLYVDKMPIELKIAIFNETKKEGLITSDNLSFFVKYWYDNISLKYDMLEDNEGNFDIFNFELELVELNKIGLPIGTFEDIIYKIAFDNLELDKEAIKLLPLSSVCDLLEKHFGKKYF